MREARIFLGAIVGNGERLRSDASAPLYADLRADAYGHGAPEVARALSAAGWRHLLLSAAADAERLAPLMGADAVLRFSDEAGVLSHTGPALYGLESDAASLGLASCMRVSARVVSVKTVEAGEGVSYGHTYRLQRRSALALVPVGYSDGLPRSAGNRGQVMLGGQPRPIAGRVAMDVHMLDLGTDGAEVGDEAVLFGDLGVTAEDFASSFDVSGVELTTGIGPRVARTYA
ncbi:alanine racemase [Salinibacterium sp. SYSU T00001]|uniref:alanine racemase C-terminal domain-containing protein n=1 Tax=Homoserinimonas sedimenticola TaxID=2986805 RepID=UPI0022358373|nr:alanine racemase C-terminal domain-containing protein [Salinibacterium sedimenticola]MCW4384508.1 alanine racemase [Salinibacterium sedimenticola]